MARKLTQAELDRELARLDEMDTKALQARWREVFKIDPPARVRAGFLRRAITYRLQEHVYGGLKPASVRLLRKVAAIDREARASKTIIGSGGGHGRLTSVTARKRLALAPGTQLVREWNGKLETVDVIKGGFVWRGQTYKTLSAVANAITGGRWSGPRFFGLLKKTATALPDQQQSSNHLAPRALPAPSSSSNLETV